MRPDNTIRVPTATTNNPFGGRDVGSNPAHPIHGVVV